LNYSKNLTVVFIANRRRALPPADAVKKSNGAGVEHRHGEDFDASAGFRFSETENFIFELFLAALSVRTVLVAVKSREQIPVVGDVAFFGLEVPDGEIIGVILIPHLVQVLGDVAQFSVEVVQHLVRPLQSLVHVHALADDFVNGLEKDGARFNDRFLALGDLLRALGTWVLSLDAIVDAHSWFIRC